MARNALSAYRGLLGGVMKSIAGFYIVFFTGLFAGVREALEAAKSGLEAASLGSARSIEAVLLGSLEEAWNTVSSEALDIAFGLGLWASGTLLFASEWWRLSSYWPGWARRLYNAASWGLRLAAIAGGLATASVVSRVAGGALPEVLDAVRSTWVFTHLYAAPLLSPVIYTLIALKYPPRGARAGLIVMLVGSLFYVYSIYSVVTAFRPLAEVSEALAEAYEAGSPDEAVRELAYSLIEAGLVAVDRFQAATIAVSTATLIYTLGFAVIALRGRRV